MRIAITGATGFIGRHVLHHLIHHSSHHITALIHSPEKAESMPPAGELLTYVSGDLYHTQTNWMQVLGYPDKLIHLAWQGLPNYQSWHHLHTNLPGDVHFLLHLAATGLRDITITGTCFEYGMQEGCLSENISTEPASPYAIAKDTLQKAFTLICNEYKISGKWLRLFYMYGRGQHPNSLFSQLESALSEGESVFNMSGGEQVRDYMTVEEMAASIVKIALQDEINGVVNCCSGTGTKVIDLVKRYLKKRGADIPLNTGYYPYPKHEPYSFWGDNQKMRLAIQAFHHQHEIL